MLVLPGTSGSLMSSSISPALLRPGRQPLGFLLQRPEGQSGDRVLPRVKTDRPQDTQAPARQPLTQLLPFGGTEWWGHVKLSPQLPSALSSGVTTVDVEDSHLVSPGLFGKEEGRTD